MYLQELVVYQTVLFSTHDIRIKLYTLSLITIILPRMLLLNGVIQLLEVIYFVSKNKYLLQIHY